MRQLLAIAVCAAVAACATSQRNPDGSYVIPARYADAPAVPEAFMNEIELARTCGRKGLYGCVVGVGTPNCSAALLDWLRIENGRLLDYNRRHERAHCAGWHHRGEYE